MSDCLGGYCFYDESFTEEGKLEEPRFTDRGQVTADVFGKLDTQILEINSKTGLYPLYVTYSAYRRKLHEITANESTIKEKQDLWLQTVNQNVFVICKTPMAKAITKRTLTGYSGKNINSHYFDDLINVMKNKPQQFIDKVVKQSYWKKGSGIMKFDAICGNPPYMTMDNGNGSSATPIYQYFVQQAQNLNPSYITMITPSRWLNGGKGLDSFREQMLNTPSIVKFVDFQNAKDCFPTTSISGGVSYFLCKTDNKEFSCSVTNVLATSNNTMKRAMNEFDVYVRYNNAVNMIRKIKSFKESALSEEFSSRNPYGLPTNIRGKEKGEIILYSSKGVGYLDKKDIAMNIDSINKYKIMVSRTSCEHAGEPDKTGMYKVLSTVKILKPGEVCTDSYIIGHPTSSYGEIYNFEKYLKTKFVRFLIMQALSGINLTKDRYCFVPTQDFTKEWTDNKLYEKYSLTGEEIEFIESMIKPIR